MMLNAPPSTRLERRLRRRVCLRDSLSRDSQSPASAAADDTDRGEFMAALGDEFDGVLGDAGPPAAGRDGADCKGAITVVGRHAAPKLVNRTLGCGRCEKKSRSQSGADYSKLPNEGKAGLSHRFNS